MRQWLLLILMLFAAPPGILAANRVSNFDQFPEAESSTGYWQNREPAPGAYQQYLQLPQALGGIWGVGPRPVELGPASFSADAHAGVYGYVSYRDCLDCHQGLEQNLHSARTTVTCRQCHRSEPVAGAFHYYSELNPIRRHAYVCAKCHEGATANFAAYVVHEPNPIAAATAESFPALFYATWVMVILAGGVFAFFIPYVGLWGIRELIAKIFGEHSREQS